MTTTSSAASRTLHPYQDEAIDFILEPGHAGVEHPTGSGKTICAIAAASLLLSRKIRVLIVTTQVHIESAFTDRPYASLVRRSGETVPCPPELVRAGRDNDTGSVDALLTYVTETAPSDHILVCTHAALVRAFPPSETLPADLRHCVLMIDEFHRGPSPGLGQVIQEWTEKGGKIVALSATFFRSDGEDVVLPNMRMLRRSLAEHIDPEANDGRCYGPRTIESRITPVPADDVSEEVFSGRAVPDDELVRVRMIDATVAAWVSDGKPKAVVRVPSLIGGSAIVVAPLIAAFEAAGARVLDATGTATADATRFREALTSERSVVRYVDSAWDVVVGVNRVLEGMDWPLCSHVYAFGLPRSLLPAVQFLGRATRTKTITGYPRAHRDVARISFVVPVAPGQTLSDYHRRHTCFMICHLVNPTAAAEWSLIKDLERGLSISIVSGAQTTDPDVRRSYPRLDPKIRLATVAAIAAARSELLASGGTASDVAVYERVRESAPTLNAAVVKQVIVEEEAAQAGESGRRIRDRLIEDIRAARNAGLAGRSAIEAAFESVLLDLDQYAVARSDRFAEIDSKALALTGSKMTALARRLFSARPITPEWVTRVVRAHLTRKGTLPTGRTPNGPPDHPEETWAGIDAALRTGSRGWPLTAPRTLYEFGNKCARHRTVRDLLGDFLKAVPGDAAETALSAHLATSRVKVKKDLIPLGELTEDQLTPPRVAAWARALIPSNPPIVGLYASTLTINLTGWLMTTRDVSARRSVAPRPKYTLDRFTVLVPCPDAYRVGEEDVGVTFRPSDRFVASWSGSDDPLSPARIDGAAPRTRFQAGYRDATVGVTVGRGSTGRPLPSGPKPDGVSVNVSVPLSWITSTVRDGTETRVPENWADEVTRIGLPELD